MHRQESMLLSVAASYGYKGKCIFVSKKKSKKRRRGALLTTHGLHRLQDAKQQTESNENQKFTFEALSLRTNLDSHTLCKIFNRTAKVDKKSLAKCFQAFNLMLQPNDYDSSTVLSPDLNSVTVEISSVDSILETIETLSPNDRRILLDIIQFRFGDDLY